MTGKIIKIALLTLSVIFGIWFFLPTVIYGIFNSGSFFGLLACLILFLYGLFFRRINKTLIRLLSKRLRRVIFILACVPVAALALFCTVTGVLMIDASGKEPEKGEQTTAVVLGCRIYESGPSLMLQGRLDAAYEFLTLYPEAKCVLSGGQGQDEHMSEGRFMYEYLISKGIAPDRLYIEERSTSTRENLEFSKKIMEKEGLSQRVTIITSDFHEYRAQRIGKSLSLDCRAFSGHTPALLMPTYCVREMCGVLYEIFLV